MSPFNVLLKDLSSKTVTDLNYVWLEKAKQTNTSGSVESPATQTLYFLCVKCIKANQHPEKQVRFYFVLGDLPERDLEELVSLLGESGHGLLPS